MCVARLTVRTARAAAAALLTVVLLRIVVLALAVFAIVNNNAGDEFLDGGLLFLIRLSVVGSCRAGVLGFLVAVHGHGSWVLLWIVFWLAALATRTTTLVFVGVILLLFIHWVLVDNDSAAVARLALSGKGLDEASAQALTGHLYQAQGGDLRDLVARAVTAKSLLEAAQDQLLVFRQDHIDEVDDDHAAQVTQAHLAHNLLSCLQVVAGDSLFEVTAGTGELAGVDVDDGHRLSAVDDKRAARRQPHLTAERLVQLLVDAVGHEGVLATVCASIVLLHAVGQVVGHGINVCADGVVGTAAVNDELGEVLIKEVTDDLDQQVRLFVKGDRLGTLGGLLMIGAAGDVLPQVVETVHVSCDCFF